MPSFDVIAIGSATQDVFLRSSKFAEVMDRLAPDGVDACFPMGAKIGIDDIIFASGGGATNAAVTFARFGLKTSCLTRVGKDASGEDLIAQLKKEKVDTKLIQRDPSLKTSYSIILLSGTGHRAILVYRGASSKLSWTKLPQTKWIYLTSLGGDLALLRQVFAFAKKTHARIAWNPGNGELERGMKTLAPFLKQTSVLILNREEAALLTELPKRHLEAILKKLAVSPFSTLVVTDGAHGAYVHADGQTLFAPALKAKRLNTTGAGDAFGSAFVASVVKGHDVRRSLQAAMLNATNVIMHMGAKAGILKGEPSEKNSKQVKITIV